MEIPEQALAELKEIHRKLTGDELSDEDVLVMGQALFRLFFAIYNPIPKSSLVDSIDKFPEFKPFLDGGNSVR